MSGSTLEKPEVRDSDKMSMLEAAMDSDTEEVMKYIREGRVHVDDYDDDRVTALQVAAATGNVQLVTALLEHGADIDFCNQVGMTAFHQACREGNLKVIEVLLQRGADIHRLTYLGSSALTLAASGGHDQIVKKLINLTVKTSGFDAYSPTMATPLIAAAFRGNAVSLSHLVKIGKANINEVAERLLNLSPLTCAVFCSTRPMIACLLELEADPHQSALRGKTAMWLADYQKRHDIVELFNDHTSKRKIPTETKDLRQLILEGDLVKMSKAIERKEIVQDGVPPTVFSTLAGSLTALRHMLVQLDQPVTDAESKLALDSLMVAALLRDHEFVELLLSNGASTSAMNNLGQTAWDLYLASFEDADDAVRLALSPYSPKKQSVFRLSGGAGPLTKMLSSSRHKFGMHDRSDSQAAAIRMREMYEMRKATWPMVGRNHRKLLLAGDLILGRREWSKRREKHNLNRIIDVARSMTEESQSFAAVCFFDLYNRDTEPRGSQTVDSDQLPKDVLDLAVHRSSSYGFRGRKVESQQMQQQTLYSPLITRSPYPSSRFSMTRSPGVSGSGDPLLDVPQQTRIRRSETTGGGTPHRTTPRMIKKSRDSISSVDSLGSARSLAISSNSLIPLEESSSTLRSFRSTPHLVGVVPPRRNSPYSTRVTRGEALMPGSAMQELKRMGFTHLVNIFEDQDVTEYQLTQTFDEEDFKKMGITSKEDIDALKAIQIKFTR
ncbi:mlt-2 [Pristionchus pacificus]|nr:mlt-2 [Pristionchus pacificus]